MVAENLQQGWHLMPTQTDPSFFKDPKFVASALRKMVAQCVELHPMGRGLYTDGERKTMLAAADHLDEFVKRTAN